MKYIKSIALGVFAVLWAASPLEASTLFFDDFQSYADGSNLIGQGGWTGCGTMPLGASSNLPTRVARADISSAGCSGLKAGFAYADHAIAGSIASSIATLSFNAYAPTGSHNVGFSLTDDGGATVNGIYIFTDMFNSGWHLNVYQNGSEMSKSLIAGGTGVPSFFQIVVDAQNQTVFANYDFGSGLQTTPTLSFAGNTTAGQWNLVSMFSDRRFGLPQAEFDNINLTSTPVPEPSSLILAVMGILGMIRLRRKHQ